MFFTKTAIGGHHIKSGIVCQDYSASYHDAERTIVTSCDGHGGAVYLRSDRGAKFASYAAINVLRNVNRRTFYRRRTEDVANQLRVQLLCEWNAMVERDLAAHPLRKSETAHLTDDQRFSLRMEPVKAYGTTVAAAMLYGSKLVILSLGDGGCFLFRRGRLIPAFEEEDEEQVANLTNSLCQSDAAEHMHVGIFDADRFDGALLCTDGVINPYQTLDNFERSLAIPAAGKVIEHRERKLSDFIVRLGGEIGVGDDVTLSILLKDDVNRRTYSKEV